MASPQFRWPRVLVPALICLLLIAIGVTYYLVRRAPAPPTLAFSDFLGQVESDNVTQIRFGDASIGVLLKDGRVVQTFAPREFLSSSSTFVTDLVKRGIRVDVLPPADPSALS